MPGHEPHGAENRNKPATGRGPLERARAGIPLSGLIGLTLIRLEINRMSRSIESDASHLEGPGLPDYG